MKKLLTIICCLCMFCVSFALVGCAEEEQSKTYTINFIVENEVWKTLTSDKIDELTNPTKQYCDFVYWEFDEESVKDNSCDVYAKFKLNSRYTCSQVLSDSMAPALRVNDYIIIDTEATEFKVGDIIVYEPTSGVVCNHRIIAIDGDDYTIKGDNNALEDAVIVRSSQIIGLVCENIGPTLPDDVIR